MLGIPPGTVRKLQKFNYIPKGGENAEGHAEKVGNPFTHGGKAGRESGKTNFSSGAIQPNYSSGYDKNGRNRE